MILKPQYKRYRYGWNHSNRSKIAYDDLDKKIKEEFPKISLMRIREIKNLLGKEDMMFREIVLRNVCCKEEAISYLLQIKDYYKGEYKECYQFELELHKYFISAYKTIKCTLSVHSNECRGYHNDKDIRRKPLINTKGNSQIN